VHPTHPQNLARTSLPLPADTDPWAPPPSRTAPSPEPVGPIAFPLAIFVSAFLLFQIQPLIGKYILPWFGGTAGVWSVCMLFFQILLLGGYAYAHLSARLLTPRSQAVLHCILLLCAIVLLPVTPSDRWRPQPGQAPTLAILTVLAATVGFPYFVLSATSPLLQSWFTSVNSGRSPYRLYALSNTGSLLGLLTYPFIIEPLLTRRAQSLVWSAGLVAFVLAAAACARHLRHLRLSTTPELAHCRTLPDDLAPRPLHRLLYLLLPACGSALLVSATSKICQDIAVIPFLWVLPLVLYLLTFIIPFHSIRLYRRWLWVVVLLAATACLFVTTFYSVLSITLRISLSATIMLAACMICHGELAAIKPSPAYLTSFYLSIAAGSAAGACAAALIAPVLFNGYYEFYLAVLFLCAVLLILLISQSWFREHRLSSRISLYGVLLAGGLLIVLTYLEASFLPDDAAILAKERTFYGLVSVYERFPDDASRTVRVMRHDAIVHGAQLVRRDLRRHPLGYYGDHSGPDRAFKSLPPGPPRRVGIIGLGVGTLAAYARPGDTFRFYEINPLVERLARARFSFLADSPATIDVVLGDARLSLERESPQQYDMLFVDAFSGDAIPVHLITQQAIEIYLRHLANDGLLLFNVSNRHVDLQPILAGVADRFSLHVIVVPSPQSRDSRYDYPSNWVILTRSSSRLQAPALAQVAEAPKRIPFLRLWTDDYATLLPVLK